MNLFPDVINGDTAVTENSSTSRQGKIKTFQQKPGFDVIILSPLAVGFGVNIQAANHVIHFTRSWNPAKEDQATDRAYRIGQTKDVFVYYLVVVADDFTTFDAKLHRLLEQKRSLSNDMLNGTGDVSPTDFQDLEGIDGESIYGDQSVKKNEITSMNPDFFEAFCAALWSAQGYSKVIRTPKSGDGGVDVVAIRGHEGLLIQCKSSGREMSQLGWEAVKDVVAGTAAYEHKYPGVTFRKLAMTNQSFNSTARSQANLNHVELIDQDMLIDMLNETPVKLAHVESYLL